MIHIMLTILGFMTLLLTIGIFTFIKDLCKRFGLKPLIVIPFIIPISYYIGKFLLESIN